MVTGSIPVTRSKIPSVSGRFLIFRESNGPLRKVACGKFSGHGVIETTLVAPCAPQGFRSDSRYPLQNTVRQRTVSYLSGNRTGR